VLSVAILFVALLAVGALPFGGGVTASSAYQYEYDQATLVVVKHVVNDGGGTAAASDFTISVNQAATVGPSSFPGSETGTQVVVTPGSYTISESGPAGYLGSYSSGCSGTIVAGATVTCTITNNDINAPLSLVTICFRGKTIVVQQKFVDALLSRGATLGPC